MNPAYGLLGFLVGIIGYKFGLSFFTTITVAVTLAFLLVKLERPLK